MNKTLRTVIVTLVTTLILSTVNHALAKDAEPIAISAVETINKKMDDFHDAADKGDAIRYLNHFAKDGVFMGTDDWERWPYDAFSKYVKTHFKDGKGWSYKPVKRFTSIGDQQQFAWVDEIVESKKWGRFRGTAVLEKAEFGWKLKHYSLNVLVPNESWEGVSEITKKAFEERNIEAGQEPPTVE